MTTTGYQSLIEHYEACLARHGDSHLGVDWPDAADAEVRYRVMLELLGPSISAPVSVLDFGCGAAHWYDYLQRQGLTQIDYVGLDASHEFIGLCRRKHPGLEFHAVDVLATEASLPEADYVVMNGVLTEKRGLSFEEMLRYTERLLLRVFPMAKLGLAFNVMSKHVDWERDDLFHLPFDTLAAFLKQRVSRHFQFRADYGLYEYTTYVYREPR